MAYQFILYEVEQGVARLTLNRPDVLNSFNKEMAQEVQAALVETVEYGGSVEGAKGNALLVYVEQDRAITSWPGCHVDGPRFHKTVKRFVERATWPFVNPYRVGT